MRIQNTHGGVIYVKLSERHGRQLLVNEIAIWPDSDANFREAKALQDKKLIKILPDSPAKSHPVKEHAPSAPLVDEATQAKLAEAKARRLKPPEPAAPKTETTTPVVVPPPIGITPEEVVTSEQPEAPTAPVDSSEPAETPAPPDGDALGKLNWAGHGVSVGPRPGATPGSEERGAARTGRRR